MDFLRICVQIAKMSTPPSFILDDLYGAKAWRGIAENYSRL
jgi:hypothetical protein